MTATATGLSPLVAGIREAVDAHAGWNETAQLVADQLRAHLPAPEDVLTPEQRLGSPDGYISHTLHVERFAPPGDIHRVHNTTPATAISIHVYGTDLTAIGGSARRYYD